VSTPRGVLLAQGVASYPGSAPNLIASIPFAVPAWLRSVIVLAESSFAGAGADNVVINIQAGISGVSDVFIDQVLAPGSTAVSSWNHNPAEMPLFGLTGNQGAVTIALTAGSNVPPAGSTLTYTILGVPDESVQGQAGSPLYVSVQPTPTTPHSPFSTTVATATTVTVLAAPSPGQYWEVININARGGAATANSSIAVQGLTSGIPYFQENYVTGTACNFQMSNGGPLYVSEGLQLFNNATGVTVVCSVVARQVPIGSAQA
jgi:hypothetical protein